MSKEVTYETGTINTETTEKTLSTSTSLEIGAAYKAVSASASTSVSTDLKVQISCLS